MTVAVAGSRLTINAYVARGSRAAKRITCPLYIMTGKLDRLIPWQHAERLAKEVSGPVVLQVIEDGNHVAANRTYKWRPQSADWMAEQLGAQ